MNNEQPHSLGVGTAKVRPELFSRLHGRQLRCSNCLCNRNHPHFQLRGRLTRQGFDQTHREPFARSSSEHSFVQASLRKVLRECCQQDMSGHPLATPPAALSSASRPCLCWGCWSRQFFSKKQTSPSNLSCKSRNCIDAVITDGRGCKMQLPAHRGRGGDGSFRWAGPTSRSRFGRFSAGRTKVHARGIPEAPGRYYHRSLSL